jgi:hypothetical protein
MPLPRRNSATGAESKLVFLGLYDRRGRDRLDGSELVEIGVVLDLALHFLEGVDRFREAGHRGVERQALAELAVDRRAHAGEQGDLAVLEVLRGELGEEAGGERDLRVHRQQRGDVGGGGCENYRGVSGRLHVQIPHAVADDHVWSGPAILDERNVVEHDVAHHSVEVLTSEFSWCHVRHVVIAGRQLALLAGLDAVDRVARVHEEAVLEEGPVELRVRAERADHFVRLVVVGVDRHVFSQERDAVQRWRALLQLVGVPEQIIYSLAVEPELLPPGNLLAAVRADVGLRDVRRGDPEAAVAVLLADGIAVERQGQRRISGDVPDAEGAVAVDVELPRQLRIVGVDHDAEGVPDLGVLLDVGEQLLELALVVVDVDHDAAVGRMPAHAVRNPAVR